MTRTISLITGIAVTALVFGVPTAVGKGRAVCSAEPGAVASLYANERATPAIHKPGVPASNELNRLLGSDAHIAVTPSGVPSSNELNRLLGSDAHIAATSLGVPRFNELNRLLTG